MSENTVNAVIWLSFIFFSTTLGSAFTYFFPNRAMKKYFAVLSGFAVGVMIAASVWSLLIPSIESSVFSGGMKVFEAVSGCLLGGMFMIIVSKVLPDESSAEINSFSRLFIAVTMHNIPEGLAVGFAFGAARTGAVAIAAAVAVAFGIGIQNVPEGAAVSFSARRIMKNNRAFLFGTLSGAVEPVAGIIGLFSAAAISAALPYLMSFAAGAMIFASITDILPDALSEGKIKTGVGALLGFLLMMSLDVIFG